MSGQEEAAVSQRLFWSVFLCRFGLELPDWDFSLDDLNSIHGLRAVRFVEREISLGWVSEKGG